MLAYTISLTVASSVCAIFRDASKKRLADKTRHNDTPDIHHDLDNSSRVQWIKSTPDHCEGKGSAKARVLVRLHKEALQKEALGR